MSGRVLALAVLATGCDGVFGLERAGYPADVQVEDCPQTYSAATGAPHKYRLEMELELWRDAAADCRDDSVTHITHLVTWSNRAELQALQDAYGNPFASIRVHVGYARQIGAPPLDKMSFQAVTEGVAPLDSWHPGEPNNLSAGGIQETVMSVSGLEALADDNPRTMRPYLCSCDGVVADRTFALE
jgi:hypothetical protein